MLLLLLLCFSVPSVLNFASVCLAFAFGPTSVILLL
jgi:hypothetical protein